MINNRKTIKISFFTVLIFIVLFFSLTPNIEARDPIYNAFVSLDLQWAEELPDKPIVPRNEIAELKLRVIVNINTGQTFGAGLLEGYSSSTALIALEVVDYPSWCSATLNRDLFETNISSREEILCNLYININENAPAYKEGIIKFKAEARSIGLIQVDKKIFNLSFKPAFFPIIKTELPETNTKRVHPTSKAIFPIEIQNAGNAETKVFFEILNEPKGWTTTVTDSLILDKNGYSKKIAYLTVIPPRDIGYHIEDTVITLKILPAFSDNINITGRPIYANFLIKNKGFSNNGLEFYLPIAIITLLIIVIIFYFLKRKKKNKRF
jgi:hypothetical protein